MPLIGHGFSLIDESSSPFANHSYYTSGYHAFRKKRKRLDMAKHKTLHKKHKKKKNSNSKYGTEKEPALMSSGLATSRTKTVPKEELPSLYNEDLGIAGAKVKSIGPLLSGPQVVFDIPVTTDEEHRRKQRQVRFLFLVFVCVEFRSDIKEVLTHRPAFDTL